ncbi:beta-ketoacyl synthase N-terminal-like domain-containing protein [Streptomyces sp. AP-93]|uniref:beta-ketoacyl synthase N-terminal-like domain-containing protein n=1 Tax=Streptomyces sp. AP-93 TaxID=2929048 RepID=UPI001FAEA02A|nr:beta-ketoacyl synthase N-terminal-like domain-containing protein [Streptomyces sp. AP-93]MCJ0871747.1 beta-ketoacyl-[acyl-carrier-protein] synthase family protein [Streptomyces sp. AP-93]
MTHEVVVTGIGAVTCHGNGTDALWRAMTAAGVRLPDRPADPHARMDRPLINLVPDRSAGQADPETRASGFALTAAREALADAGLHDGLPAGSAVVLGSCMGEPGLNERGRGADGTWRPPFRLASQVAAELGLFGTAHEIANACAAGGYALGAAADLIRSGEADVVLAGGSDAYSRVALGCFNRLGAVDPVRCRPFDRQRAGTVFAEGAGLLVLESAAHAAARGARSALRLTGAGWSCDAGHPTAPESEGEQIERAMREAVGPDAGPVGCVIPHGTGTQLNDVIESRVLHRVFGAAAADLPLYSLKALLGHAGGASAALGAVAAALILRHGSIPPNVPVEDPDEQCEVRLPGGSATALPAGARRVLVNAYAFGGNNASLVLEEAA